MAVEQIGVKNSRVLAVGIGSLAILVAVRFGLTTYFTDMTDREVETKRVSTGVERIHAFRAEEGKALDKSKGALDQAMKNVADRQRGPEPKQSTDNAAVEGWKEQLPRGPAAVWPLPPPLPAPVDATDGGADGAADASTDASVTDASIADAGATTPPPHKHH